MDLYQNADTYTPDNLFANLDVTALTKAVTLAGAQGVVKRGTVLGIVTATGLAVPVDNAQADGSEVADCILVEDVDTTDGDIVAEAYRTGHFNRQALIFGGDDTAADHEGTLRKLGIYLSDNISY